MQYPFNITSAELKRDYSRVENSTVYVHNKAVPVLRDNGFFKKSGGEFDAVELNEFGLEIIISHCSDTKKNLRLVVLSPDEYSWSGQGSVSNAPHFGESESNIPFTD